MADQARRVSRAVELPLVADADTGFGNALNVGETVRAYERAGVAGLHIEDQVSPKKCGHFAGKDLISPEEMTGKIHAALDARTDPDFLVIARTDARSVAGLDEAIRRAKAYAAAGAGAIFVETPESTDEYAAIARALPDVPLVADVTEGGRSPALTADEYLALGFKIVLFSASAARTVMRSLQDLYGEIWRARTTNNVLERIVGFEERNRILGLADIYELEKRYRPAPSGG
jgi:2-methylisocitrate lyase-like PEP mutase family enzyme